MEEACLRFGGTLWNQYVSPEQPCPINDSGSRLHHSRAPAALARKHVAFKLFAPHHMLLTELPFAIPTLILRRRLQELVVKEGVQGIEGPMKVMGVFRVVG